MQEMLGDRCGRRGVQSGLGSPWLPPGLRLSGEWCAVQAYAESFERCQRLIRELDVPPPYRPEDMVGLAQLVLKRPVRLVELPGGSRLTGLLLDAGSSVLVCVNPRVPGVLSRHVVAHQLGHLLLGHRLEQATNGHRVAAAEHAQGGGRCGLDPHAEYEAELFAMLMLAGRTCHDLPVRRDRKPGPLERAVAAFTRGYALVG